MARGEAATEWRDDLCVPSRSLGAGWCRPILKKVATERVPPLLERELDPFFFFARNEIVSGNDARAALLL